MSGQRDPKLATDAWACVLGAFHEHSPWFRDFPAADSSTLTIGVPASIFVNPAGRQSSAAGQTQAPWASLTSADGPASRLYLSLVAYAQVSMSVDTPVTIDLRHDSPWSADHPRDFFRAWSAAEGVGGTPGSLGVNLLIGRNDRLVPWTKCLNEALDRLRTHHLISPRRKLAPHRPAPGKKSIAVSRTNDFDVWVGPPGVQLTVERPITFRERGYNEPKAVPVPLGFFTNGWCARLSGKETHTLLALLYQFARQPTHAGHFVAPSERDFLGLVDKSYQRSLVTLVDHGFITPVNEARFRDRRGKGARHDLPHEFNINFDVFSRTPTA